LVAVLNRRVVVNERDGLSFGTELMHLGTVRRFRSVTQGGELGEALDSCDETVTLPWLCLNITRILGVVIESTTQFLDSAVQTSFEIDKYIVCPETLPEFFAGHQFAGVVQEQKQDFERLTRQFYLETMLAQFGIMTVHFIGAETQNQMRRALLLNLFWFLLHRDFCFLAARTATNPSCPKVYSNPDEEVVTKL
jgi:hypothetical protein